MKINAVIPQIYRAPELSRRLKGWKSRANATTYQHRLAICIALMLAAAVAGGVLLGFATGINTGALEEERWTRVTISSRSAFNLMVVWGFAWVGMEYTKRYVKRPLLKVGAYLLVFLLAYALVNLLGFFPPINI